ncbi:MAG TPA: EAL domain-containing protein [Anaeromyxobacter sp.]
MRRRIGLALLAIFACSAAGAVMALAYIQSTTDALRNLTQLHRVEEMRQHLLIAIQASQSDLYGVDGDPGRQVNVIAENVAKMDRAADRCEGCHHAPAVKARIDGVRGLIGDYETALSSYVGSSASRERRTKLRAQAASVASALLTTTETMALDASRGVQLRTAQGMRRFDQARAILTASIVLTLVVALFIGLWLARSITLPIDELVTATRAIAGGDLGFSIAVKDATEFGELARHFNSMSAALRESYQALHTEIEERKSAETRLLYDAFHDALTGLPNRALFVDRLEQVIGATDRHPGERYAVLFLDLDRFKVINDSLGHVVGDHLLVAVGERIESSLRPGDTVARLGGDEFGVLLQGMRDGADALQVADRIQKALTRSLVVEGHELFVTTSIGIALQSDRYTKPDQVLRDADVAMYQAKLKGKACSELFDAAMHGSVVDRMQLEADLRRAVEHGESFALHYQPILALRTGKLIAVEALVRWRHAARGLLDATDFVPLAEESGTIVPLGEWAIRAACAQLREWQERSPALAGVTMSINVSGRQFGRPEYVESLRRILLESAVDPRQLAIEVTESAIMNEVETSAAKLGRLRDMGVQIHVDDFGTGYSSLSYLHRFPITAVKIDQSFVAGLPSQESEEVIKAIVSIAESLDFDVIAEGIEVASQLSKLEELRCRYGQGFFMSRPMEASALEAWVLAQSRSVA